jgi:hypothetical protein
VVISRRQLIGCGLAASVLGVANPLANAVQAPVGTFQRIDLVVVDDRFDLARQMARSIASPVIPRVALPRDVLALWHRELAPLCRSGTQSIAGVTTERGFFLLGTLAADHRYRVLSRTLHPPRLAGEHEPLLSWVLAPRTMRS